ncbi:MAG: hypothetical protein WAU91_02325 [Desulfatitalea sp.]
MRFAVQVDPEAYTLLLKDKAGGKAVLQKTAEGVTTTTTGLGRTFQYGLTPTTLLTIV